MRSFSTELSPVDVVWVFNSNLTQKSSMCIWLTQCLPSPAPNPPPPPNPPESSKEQEIAEEMLTMMTRSSSAGENENVHYFFLLISCVADLSRLTETASDMIFFKR